MKLPYLKYAFIFLIGAGIFITACKSEESPGNELSKKEKMDAPVKGSAEVKTISKEKKQIKPEKKTTNLVGRWEGKFDGRKTVLNISEQTGMTFKGKITINYRNVIKQEVNGVFNPVNNTITMTDMLHSRYAGSYLGNFDESNFSYSGTFTMKVDKKKLKFNLSKK